MLKEIIFFLMFITTSSLLFSQDNEDETSDVQNPILTDKFLFGAGIFSPDNKISIGANGVIETDIFNDIEFDERFQLDDVQTTFTFNFTWRFATNYSVSADYFSVSTENSLALDETIEWNDLIFDVGVGVTAGYDFSLYRIFFGRIISRGNKHEFGGGLGVHIVKVAGFIEGFASLNGTAASFQRSKVDTELPLPNIGFWYYWAPTEKWAFTARSDWFGISISNIAGSLWHLTPGVNYQAFKNIGFTLQYNYLTLEAEVDKDSWKGQINMKFYGPAIAVTANF